MKPYALDRARIKELFDLRSLHHAVSGGQYQDDPYPIWGELREKAHVHEGTPHELVGYTGPAFFQALPYPDRPHFSVMSYEACDKAFRDDSSFISSDLTRVPGRAETANIDDSMLYMDGSEHRRYRGLVQPSFVPAKAKWWIDNWINTTVQSLIDGFIDQGKADLNVDFCAAIPVVTITGSFGIPIEQALDVRESISRNMAKGSDTLVEIMKPILAARREKPEDDLISVLVEAELKDEDGTTHRLSDVEILNFTFVLMAAGSGTTWKQMGITLTALLRNPEYLKRVRENPALLRPAIEESVRWEPTDPAFGRFAQKDVEFYGMKIPKGSAVHMVLGAANRDPKRWDRPDVYDIDRKPTPHLAFGQGPHVCIGMHVARAEMAVGIGALLERLPNLRLDPDAEAPRFIGMYERAATEIPVLWG